MACLFVVLFLIAPLIMSSTSKGCNINDDRKLVLERISDGGDYRAVDVLKSAELECLRYLPSSFTNAWYKLCEKINEFGEQIEKQFAGENIEDYTKILNQSIKEFADTKDLVKAVYKKFKVIRATRTSFTILLDTFIRHHAEKLVAEIKLRPLYMLTQLSKVIVLEFYSEGGVGSWLDIPSFAQDNNDFNQTTAQLSRQQAGLLWLLLQLSKLQSKALDVLMNDMMVNEHKKNKNKLKNKLAYKISEESVKAVVVGCSLMLPYSALQLWRAGMDVTQLVDECCYPMVKIEKLDPKWTAQLRILLGVHFDSLLTGDAPAGLLLGEHQQYLHVNNEVLKEKLNKKLKSLEAFARQILGVGTSLQTINISRLGDIEKPNQQSRHFSLKHYYWPWEDKTEALTETPFDILVFVDDIYKTLNGDISKTLLFNTIGASQQETETKLYSATIVHKGKFLRKNMLSVEGKYGGIITEKNQETMNSIKNHIETLGFCKQSYKKYTKIEDRILKSMKSNLEFEFIESQSSISVVAVTDPVIAKLVSKLGVTATDDLLKQQFNTKFLALLIKSKISDVVVEDKEDGILHEIKAEDVVNIDQNGNKLDELPNKLNFHINSFDTTLFEYTQYTRQKAAFSLITPTIRSSVSSVIILALSDAHAMSHILHGTGLSSNRYGVEITANIFKNYAEGDLLQLINSAMEKARKHALVEVDPQKELKKYKETIKTA